MLVGFSVCNYKSFKDIQKISFIASKICRHGNHTVKSENHKLLKSGLIFGANAGGKTNLISAIDFSRKIIVHGLDKVNLSNTYHRISNEYYTKPGVFEYRIILNGVEYSYGIAISYYKQEILSEWLYKIKHTGDEVCIFNRNVDENGISKVETDYDEKTESDFARLKIYFEDFGENISDSFRTRTILSDIAARGNGKSGLYGEIFNVFSWVERILVIFPDTKYTLLNELGTDKNKKPFFEIIMQYFDTGIEAIENQSQAIDFDELFKDMPRSQAEKIKADLNNKTKQYNVTMRIENQIVNLHRDENGNIVYNKLLLNHGNPDDKFEYMDESDGTKRLFDLIPLLYDNTQDRLIVIDELDRSLHTKLVTKFIEIFFNRTSENQSQLIATTHDSNLLDLDLMRQDEIWFVERGEDHSSVIYSLNKFKERFDKKVEKDYLLGRYGAIPLFNESMIIGDENEE